ncbi:TusA-related sulfurtransferase [Acetoanaerobium pronyense]|mgnify:CR=1 FL=1|uniref:TusA-related sulfurtransferase n=1 Tax=Acetoanaerobium pronyense TaxID=1482736 RepID=A0ABS4KME0_9FIRM|nr:sulfurtransferase TusA family protein [Acetoanaerobium pronyense]MBP2028401.1 TusA-related sulfurtransferase [Acetoanaerobium pronyense]
MEYKVLDCLYEICPIPLLKANKELERMHSGEILVLLTNHNCAISNVVEWAKDKGHEIDYIETGEGEWEIFIEKK